MEEIIYLTNVRLPTDKAHGLQIMKSCEAFTKIGIKLELIVPKLKPSHAQDPFLYYGIRHRFPIKKLFVLEVLPLDKLFGDWVGYIQNLSFSLSAVVYLIFSGIFWKNKTFYSRDYMTLWWLCLMGLRPVAELHDYRSREPKKRIAFILKHSRKIVLNSEGTKTLLQKHYSLDDRKIVVAGNGVDLDFFDISVTREEARAKLNIHTDKTIVGYVGRLETVGFEKGIPMLVESFKAAISAQPNLMLYVVGGPIELVEQYKKKIPGDLKQSIVFAGQVPYGEIPLYLRAIDVLVIPAPQNQHMITTSPIKLFEFLAAGKVIVAADLPSFHNYLNEGNAIFFQPEDNKDLADKILKITKDEILANSIAFQAKVDAKQYGWEKRVEKINNFINA